MENANEGGGWGFQRVFQIFVVVSLSALLGSHIYHWLSGTGTAIEGDFSEIKYVVHQLTEGLSEVNRKHENLKSEISRISLALPSATYVTKRAKEALRASSFSSSNAIQNMDIDRQIADYALESAGARVLDTGDTIEHVLIESPATYALYLLTAFVCRGSHCLSARAMLRPGALPGECWAFKGSRGTATIRLLGTVHITALSLEHIPVHISPTNEISSAPRLFQLEGLQSRSDKYPHDFGTFEYDLMGKPIQYFEVRNPTTKGYNVVRLNILSNWGNPVFTCVYRLRIHGELSPGQSPKRSEEELIENE